MNGDWHRVERLGELPGTIPDQEPEPGGTLPQIHQQVPCLLGWSTGRPGARSRRLARAAWLVMFSLIAFMTLLPDIWPE